MMPLPTPAVKPVEEHPLATVLSARAFPGRAVLQTREVAAVCGCTARHVRDLCAEGVIKGAFSIGGDTNEKRPAFWRIPVSAYDAWLKRRSNMEAYQE